MGYLGYNVRMRPPKVHTAADKERFRQLTEMGCIACRINTGAFVQSEVAHCTSRGRRLGHQATIPLCPWHHRGHSGDLGDAQCRLIYGPSFAKSKDEFEQFFGTELQLLEKVNAWLGSKVKRV